MVTAKLRGGWFSQRTHSRLLAVATTCAVCLGLSVYRLLLLPHDLRNDTQVCQAVQLDLDDPADLPNGCWDLCYGPVNDLRRGRHWRPVQRFANEFLSRALHVRKLFRSFSALRDHVHCTKPQRVPKGKKQQ